MRTFSDVNLQKHLFRLAISLPALPGGCSGGGGDSDGLSGIAADCAVVADASIAFGEVSEAMLQAAKHCVDNQVCRSSVAGRFYPFTGLSGCRALSVRFSLFILLLCWLGLAGAEYTGVAFEIADYESDWKFGDVTHAAKINSLSLQIEERAESGLTVGASIAYLSMRIGGGETTSSTKFDGENLQIYLRQNFSLGESSSLEGLLSYGYNTGRENVEGERADIQWSQVSAEIGLSFRFDSLRITPFTSYTDIDGDISGVSGFGAFELDDPFSHGVRFDIFVDSTAFVGIRLQTGSQTGGYISFVRRY